MQEVDNIKRILKETLRALKGEDTITLKSLSDQTIHTASITQDPDNVAVAVIVYALSKILERPAYRTQKNWNKVYTNILVGVEHALQALANGDETHLANHLEKLRKRLEGFSGNMKRYIQDVFTKASINKASKIYEHGISMEKTAKLLGITLWELANYAGSRVDERSLAKTINTKQRLMLAMGMFS